MRKGPAPWEKGGAIAGMSMRNGAQANAPLRLLLWH